MPPAEPSWHRPPYPGLEAFTRDQAPIFFGRERKVDELVARLGQPDNRVIALVGASGTGKSSLIRAGLLDRLAKGALPGSQHWLIAELTPAGSSDDPLRNLATAIKHCGQSLAWSERDKALELRRGGWRRLVDEVLAGYPDWAELVVFVDQFEELFRLVPDGIGPEEHRASTAGLASDGGNGPDDYRGPFLKWLGEALEVPRVRLLLTLRVDFLPDCLRYQVLADLLNAGQMALASPGPHERWRMVTEPARRAGIGIDERLADRIVEDTGDEPGALPLMAYALERLYTTDGGRGELTMKSYKKLGRVAGAIAHQATNVFDAFAAGHGDEQARHALECLFAELVNVDDDGAATRRRARLASLDRQYRSAALVRQLANALIAARLLVTDEDGSGRPVIDVAHEALLSAWEPLRVWIGEYRDDLRLHRLLRDEVRRWEQSGFSTKHLRSDSWVEDARTALSRLSAELTEEQWAYLDPVARARLLLNRDVAAWLAAGCGDMHLWDHDRFAGCGKLTPGAAGELEADARAFLRTSFDAAMTAEHEHPLHRAEIGRALALLGDPASIRPVGIYRMTRPWASSRSRRIGF